MGTTGKLQAVLQDRTVLQGRLSKAKQGYISGYNWNSSEWEGLAPLGQRGRR